MTEPVWITVEMALAFHRRQIAEHGGGGDGIRDLSLIESAIARPQQLFHYESPPPSLTRLAASYAYGIAKNHPFVDGNKRTAFVVFRVFLKLNKVDFIASKEDRYLETLKLAGGEHTEESFTQWLDSVTNR